MKANVLLLTAVLWVTRAEAELGTVKVPLNAGTRQGDIRVDQVAPSGVYQQVFDASLFASGLVLIKTAVLRPALNNVAAGGDIFGVTVELSTTQKQVGSLSPVFAENLGADNKVLFSSSQTTFFSSAAKTSTLMEFSPIFGAALGNAFLYDPSKGNLLMTIHNLHFPRLGYVFAWDGIRGSPVTSSVRSSDQSATEGKVSSDALVTEFVVDTVPEPSLGIPALVAVAVAWRLRRARTPRTESTQAEQSTNSGPSSSGGPAGSDPATHATGFD